MFRLTENVIETATLEQSLRDSSAGAFVAFEGRVRNHNQGEKVSALEYQVYEELAVKEAEKILSEARRQFNVVNLTCVHRHGLLQIGECAVWVGATAAHRDDAYRASRYVIDALKLRLPIWKKEHYENTKPEWVFCRDHNNHVDFKEKDFYEKQKNLLNQDLLKKSKVLVVGAGGLGCPALQSLTLAGVGQMTLVDNDKIEISNLHRQPLFSILEVGERKATEAARKLRQLNPFIQVAGVDARVSLENVAILIQNQDLVLDCTDNLETKFLLHDACLTSNTPLISASIYKDEGRIRTLIPRSPFGCFRCQYKAGLPEDSAIGNCNDLGMIGASATVIGSIQAREALMLLQEGTNNTSAETFLMSLSDLSLMKIRNHQRPDCGCVTGTNPKTSPLPKVENFEITSDQLGSDYELVDIRYEDDSILENYKSYQKKIVFYCHRGIRSRGLVKRYRDKGYSHFYSLTGGSCSL